tara:strand:- start:489 stop:824 length:336 start_codon:yes stop_codon:yes gene_type:complete
MADLHKFTVAESLNTDTAGKWDVQTAVTTSDASVTHIDVSNYHNVIIDTTKTICVLFDGTSNTTAGDGNNLELPTGIHNLRVPHGISRNGSVYLHWRRNGSTNATVRMVLC